VDPHAADARRMLSPELALVSPELAEQARAELPDRPWEAFAPPPPPVLVLRPAPAAAAAPQRRWPRRRRRMPIRRALLGLGLLALLVAGFLPASDSPTLDPAPTPPAVTPVPDPGALYTIEPDVALVVSDDGGSISSVTSLRCLPEGTKLNASVGPDGSFTASVRDGETRVNVRGRFVGSDAIRGEYRVTAPGCDSGAVHYLAARR
jgi:hypothetical protein